MSGALAGKVLLLTGAAGGQGRLAAQLFVEAGAKLILTDRDESGAEVAYTALFLASDAASYVTGAELVVDGGFSA